MSSVTASGSSSSGRKAVAVILAIVAVLFLVAGIIYLVEPAKSLPAFMGHIAGSNGHHALRMAGCFVVAVVFAAGAWVAMAYKPKAQALPQNDNSPENSPAGTN